MMDGKKDSAFNENSKALRVCIYIIIGILGVTAIVQFFSTLANIFSLESAYLFSPAVIGLLLTMFIWVGFFGLVIIDKKHSIQSSQDRINKVRSLIKLEKKDCTEKLTSQYNRGMYSYILVALVLIIAGTALTIQYLGQHGNEYINAEWPLLQTQEIVTTAVWAVCLLGYIPCIRRIKEKRIKRDVVIPIYLLAGLFVQNIAFAVSRMGRI